MGAVALAVPAPLITSIATAINEALPTPKIGSTRPVAIYESHDPYKLIQRRNLFEQSSNFLDNTWWLKFEVTVTAAPEVRSPASAPWATAHKIAALGGAPIIHSNWDNFESGERRAWSIHVKKGDPEVPIAWISLDSYDLNFELAERYIELHIDLDTGEVRTPYDYIYDVDINGGDFDNLPPIPDRYKSIKAENVGDGWWRLQIGLISDVRAQRWQYAVGFHTEFDSLGFVEGKGGYIAAAQFDESLTATAYQNITTFSTTDKERILLSECLHQVTLFEDVAGTTPVTAIERPAGLQLDKSLGLARGPELVANGRFWESGNTTGYTAVNSTLSVVGGRMRVTATGGTQARATLTVNTTAGVFYEVKLLGRRAVGTTQVGAFVSGLGSSLYSSSTADTPLRFIFKASAATSTLTLELNGAPAANDAADFNEISIRSIVGNHRSQSTAASKPVLCCRYNLLTFSEQFDNAVWGKTGCTISANTTGVFDKIVEDTSTGNHRITAPGLTASANMAFVQSFRVRPAGRTRCILTFSNTVPWVGDVAPIADFTLTGNGTLNSSSGCTASIVAIGDGTYRLIVAVVPDGAGSFSARLGLHNGTSSSYTGDGVSGIEVSEGQLELGTAFTKYQRVGASTDYDIVGPMYLRRDALMFYTWTMPAAMTACTIVCGLMSEGAATSYGPNTVNLSTNVGFGALDDATTPGAKAASGNGAAMATPSATGVVILPHVILASSDGATTRVRYGLGAASSAASVTNFNGVSWRDGRTLNDAGTSIARDYGSYLYDRILAGAEEDFAIRTMAARQVYSP